MDGRQNQIEEHKGEGCEEEKLQAKLSGDCANFDRDLINADSGQKANHQDLPELEISPEHESGIEDTPGKWIYRRPDIINEGKVFDLVENYGEGLDYRQKGMLEKMIDESINGDIEKLSWDLTGDREVRDAFAEILENEMGATVKIEEGDLSQRKMILSCPALNGDCQIVFAWQGGLRPAFVIENGEKVTSKTRLSELFQELSASFRSRYTMPNPAR